MNRILCALAAMSLVFSLSGIAYCIAVRHSSVHYGFINTEKLLDGFVESQKVQEKLLQEQLKWDNAQKTMEDSLSAFEERMMLEYDTASVTTKRMLKSEQIRRMEELGRFGKARAEGLKKLQSEQMGPVYQKINVSLEEYAKKHGLDVVFASSSGSIVYGEGSKADITEDFLFFLNGRFK